MATVYLAQDLRHDRKVALKFLKPEPAAVFSVVEPRLLFVRPEFVWKYFARSFDVSVDGERFLMVSTAGSQTDE